MTGTNETPTLLVYMYGERAEGVRQMASERLLRWCRAFDDWLAEVKRTRSRNAAYSARLAWRRLSEQTSKMPWEITPADVEKQIEWLKSRGLRPQTLCAEMTNLSKFYTWCGERGVDPACGPGFNPAKKARQPRFRKYTEARALSKGEVEALLDLLRRDQTPLGARNYAFILARLQLGVPFKWIRELKWGQLDLDGPGAWVTWQPGEDPERLPGPVWEAILAYLEASGRLDGLLAEPLGPFPANPFSRGVSNPGQEYIFAPLVGGFSPGAGAKAGDWAANQVMAYTSILYVLDQYGQLAGIPKKKLNMRVLRHTANRMKMDSGASLEEMKAFTHSRGPLNKLRYKLKFVPELPPDEARLQEAVSSPEPPNHVAPVYEEWQRMTHGFYARRQPPEEVAAMRERMRAEDDRNAGWLQEMVDQMQTLSRLMIEWSGRAQETFEIANLLDANTMTLVRLHALSAERKEQRQETKADQRVAGFKAMIEAYAQQEFGTPAGEMTRQIVAGAAGFGNMPPEQLAEALASGRVSLNRLYEMALQASTAKELARLAGYYGRTCTRLVNLLAANRKGGNPEAAFIQNAINRALDELHDELMKRWDEQDRERGRKPVEYKLWEN